MSMSLPGSPWAKAVPAPKEPTLPRMAPTRTALWNVRMRYSISSGWGSATDRAGTRWTRLGRPSAESGKPQLADGRRRELPQADRSQLRRARRCELRVDERVHLRVDLWVHLRGDSRRRLWRERLGDGQLGGDL